MFELDASNEEVLEMMRRLAVEGYDDQLTAAECLEIVNFIAEFAGSRESSLRLGTAAFDTGYDSKDAHRFAQRTWGALADPSEDRPAICQTSARLLAAADAVTPSPHSIYSTLANRNRK